MMFSRGTRERAEPDVPPEYVSLLVDVAVALKQGVETYGAALERLAPDAESLDDPPWAMAANLALIERAAVGLHDELRATFDDEMQPFRATRALRQVQWALTCLARAPIDRRDLLSTAELDEILDREGARDWARMIMDDTGITTL